MGEPSSPTPLDRIERSLARIDAVLRSHRHADAALRARHATLRAKTAEALAALDALIGRRDG